MRVVTQDSEQNLTQANVANPEAAPVVAETTRPADTPTEQQFQLTPEEEALYQKALERETARTVIVDDPQGRDAGGLLYVLKRVYRINFPEKLGRNISLYSIVGVRDPEYIYVLKLLVACAEGFRQLALKVSELPSEDLIDVLLMPSNIRSLSSGYRFIKDEFNELHDINTSPLFMYKKAMEKRDAFLKRVIQKSDEGKSWTEEEINEWLDEMEEDNPTEIGLLNTYHENLAPTDPLISDLHKKLRRYIYQYFLIRDTYRSDDPINFDLYKQYNERDVTKNDWKIATIIRGEPDFFGKF